MAARCLCKCLCVCVCVNVLVLCLVSEQRVVCLITFCKCLVAGQMTRNVHFQCEWGSNNKEKNNEEKEKVAKSGRETESIRYVVDAVLIAMNRI